MASRTPKYPELAWFRIDQNWNKWSQDVQAHFMARLTEAVFSGDDIGDSVNTLIVIFVREMREDDIPHEVRAAFATEYFERRAEFLNYAASVKKRII